MIPILSVCCLPVTWVRWGIYVCFFLAGATSLVFEVLWSRQFVTVFGNSSYAVSVVLCAFMAGLGLGGLVGGRVADGIRLRVAAFGVVQLGIALWALAIPLLLEWVRLLVPQVPLLSSESLLASTLTRFGLSLVILLGPCFLMGTTLPLLVRAVTESDRVLGRRIGALYCWNTMGAACGCVAAGFWMLDTWGVRLTNLISVGVTLLVALAALALSRLLEALTRRLAAPGKPPQRPPVASRSLAVPEPGGSSSALLSRLFGEDADTTGEAGLPDGRGTGPGLEPKSSAMTAAGGLLLCVAFVNGLASLTCEVLWFRYLAFLEQAAYAFPTILGIYLLGLGAGGFVYGMFANRIQFSVRALALTEVMLGMLVMGTFLIGAMILTGGPPRPLGFKQVAWITILAPTLLMGVAFPLLCSIYGHQARRLGRGVGLMFAVNTIGTVFGSLLPIFVLVPWLGIQRSLLTISVLYGAMGVVVLAQGMGRDRRWAVAMGSAGGVVLAAYFLLAPQHLCERIFLATSFNLGRHNDILYYREGRTGTAILTRDRVNARKTLYINGNSEVPVLYADELCFKVLGTLGPLLHPKPDEVLMVCFGGGIAAGATLCVPEVKSLTIVDLEHSVVEAAKLLADDNNGVLTNSRAHVVIDDGRNYILTARRDWPVIVSDSTHPKTADSWVLYTQEFYRLVQEHLAEDGVFVQWVPKHGLRISEFKIILRTFQSVFPHASLWVTHGMDDQGQFVSYGLLVGTPGPLTIDVLQLRARLEAAELSEDLKPYGLHTPAGFLDSFICAEEKLRQWVGEGPVNTDDLPYTHYQTCYTSGKLMDPSDFIEPMEDIWPCLKGTGVEEASARLHEELLLRAKANRLAFLCQFRQAYGLLTNDVRRGRMRELYEGGPQYAETMLRLYWDNPQALVYWLSMRANGPCDRTDQETVFNRIQELDPDNVSALNYRALRRSEAGDMKSAEDCLRRALRCNPQHGVTLYNLGQLLAKTGRQDEALQCWQRAAEFSTDASVMDHWASCLARQKRVDEAIQWFQRAVENRPTLTSARLHLALWLHRTGRTPEAISHLEYLLKLDPENSMFRNILARLRESGRRTTPATGAPGAALQRGKEHICL